MKKRTTSPSNDWCNYLGKLTWLDAVFSLHSGKWRALVECRCIGEFRTKRLAKKALKKVCP